MVDNRGQSQHDVEIIERRSDDQFLIILGRRNNDEFVIQMFRTEGNEFVSEQIFKDYPEARHIYKRILIDANINAQLKPASFEHETPAMRTFHHYVGLLRQNQPGSTATQTLVEQMIADESFLANYKEILDQVPSSNCDWAKAVVLIQCKHRLRAEDIASTRAVEAIPGYGAF